MGDLVDKAGRLTEFHTRIALANARSSGSEAPVFNDVGLRICKDCNNLIPIPRVRAVNAVRCVDCQGYLEVN